MEIFLSKFLKICTVNEEVVSTTIVSTTCYAHSLVNSLL